MKCPKCGLENSSTVLWCNCGYNFETEDFKPRFISKNKDFSRSSQLEKKILVFLALAGFLLFLLMFKTIFTNQEQEANISPEPSQETTETDWTADEAKQSERKEFIQKLINRGIFKKVDYWENGATVVVDTNFYALDFDDKRDFVNVVYAYICTKTQDEYAGVELKDSLSNKTVGVYDDAGLVMK